MSNQYFVEMTGISKTFPGAKVLNNVELKVKAGEVRALIGENGAGKSTLMKILGGIYSKDQGVGTIKINGEIVEINSVYDAKHHGICIIHQEISLADNMTVADNLFMGEELLKKVGFLLDDKQMIERAQRVIDDMGIDIDVRTKVGDLSIAKQQMVEICRALLYKSKLIVMDEPTSSLTQTEIDQLFIQIEKLKQSGITIIYISHRMDEIFQIADSITILRDGELIATDMVANLNKDKLISMMVGRELLEIYKHDEKTELGTECLVVKNFTNKYLKNISFSLSEGEILGFAGLVGAGRTELARAVFGIDRIDSSGELFINGEKTVIKNTMDAIAKGIAYVPENRKTEGLYLANNIRYNISITVLEKFMRFIGVNKKVEDAIISEYESSLSIKMTSSEQKVQLLSGGNQQKVLIAKWLATDPKILILDEPTRGIDIGAKAAIYQLIYELAKKGVAIMLISSEMDEIINLSDRIVVMHEGGIAGVLENHEMSRATQEEVMWLASGGKN
ncbi:MAG: sugar ABC transporter ATP-binding protein [Ruminiclostridium sp.]